MKRPRLFKMRPSEPIPPAKLKRMAEMIREKRQKQIEEAAKAAEAEQHDALCNGSNAEGTAASDESDGEGAKAWAAKDGQVVNESSSNGHAQTGEEEEEEEEEEVPSEAALAEMQEELEALQNKKHLLFVKLKEMLREEASVKAAEDEQKRQQSEQEAEQEAEQEQEMRADEQGRSEADDAESQDVAKGSQSCQPSNGMSMRAHSAACASTTHSSFSRRQMLPARTSPLQRRQQLAAKEAQMHQLALEPHLGGQMLPRPRQQLLRPFQHAMNRMPHEFNDPQLSGQPPVTGVGVSMSCSQWSRPNSISSCNRPSTSKCMTGGSAGIGHSDMRSAPSVGGAWAGWGMQPRSPGAALQCTGSAGMSGMGCMAGGRSCGPPPPPPLPPQTSSVHLQQQLHQPSPQSQQPMSLQAQQQHKVPPPPPPPPSALKQQMQSQRPRVRPPPPPPPPPNVLGRGGGSSLFSGPFSQQPGSSQCPQPQPQSTMPPATSMFQMQHQLKPQQQMKQTHVILQQHEQWLKQQQRARNPGVPQPGLPHPKSNHWIWRGQQ